MAIWDLRLERVWGLIAYSSVFILVDIARATGNFRCNALGRQTQIRNCHRPSPILEGCICGFTNLHDRQAAEVLGCRNRSGAVVVEPQQDNNDCPLSRMLCQRNEHRVDGPPVADWFGSRTDADMTVLERHDIVRSTDIDMVLEEPCTVGCDGH